ncbi:MAG: formimidoylglutamase [Flammeovirgaceae bacterium]|nr:formimidoylglutamase [Flammeovirgaceae bacterium]MDW8286811.1 formimidoylglutamase [Flammeovirgaceae bacterium]
MNTYDHNYQPTIPSRWEGRFDGTAYDLLRWHQVIRLVNLREKPIPSLQKGQHGIAIVGFFSDEGVRRNKGREGAEEGPFMIRKACANFPVHFSEEVRFIDVGDVTCYHPRLEESQYTLGQIVGDLLLANYFVIIIGGGHEVTLGHYWGVKKFLEQQTSKQWGIYNLDTHLDLRQVDERIGATSGTSFYQIAQDRISNGLPFDYCCLGVQEWSNTKRLLDTAESWGVTIVKGEHLLENLPATIQTIDHFAQKNTYLSLSIDLDVFAAAFAPGVSATAFQGIIPDANFQRLLKHVYRYPNLISMDIAELNPRFDQDARTAKLAASCIYQVVDIKTSGAKIT